VCKHWENVRMDCKYLDCGCVVSCKERGGLVVDCDGMDCLFQEWYENHHFCEKCGHCDFCGTCKCPERFGI
jgi:hypothetical protein